DASISPPKSVRTSAGVGAPMRLEKESDAFRDLLRLNSYSAPWNPLVPDFWEVLTTAPAARPYCALMLFVSMVNSCTDSSGGVILLKPSLKLSLLSEPLSIYCVPDSRVPPVAGLKSIPCETWGARNVKSYTLRLSKGMFSMVERSTVDARSEVAVCTRTSCVDTSTAVAAVASVNVTLRGTVLLASTTTPLLMFFAKRLTTTVTV